MSEDGEGQSWQKYRQWASNIRDNRSTVYNFMLVQRRGQFYERVAVGQMDELSWSKSSPVEETILLI